MFVAWAPPERAGSRRLAVRLATRAELKHRSAKAATIEFLAKRAVTTKPWQGSGFAAVVRRAQAGMRRGPRDEEERMQQACVEVIDSPRPARGAGEDDAVRDLQ